MCVRALDVVNTSIPLHTEARPCLFTCMQRSEFYAVIALPANNPPWLLFFVQLGRMWLWFLLNRLIIFILWHFPHNIQFVFFLGTQHNEVKYEEWRINRVKNVTLFLSRTEWSSALKCIRLDGSQPRHSLNETMLVWGNVEALLRTNRGKSLFFFYSLIERRFFFPWAWIYEY